MLKIISTLFLFLPIIAFAQDRKVQNPVLPGFNPDPDIIRVEEDYYIATTTFEWWPGVNIYHSKDLENWKLIDRPLKERHIDLEGVPNSGGNYIPSLLYNENDSLFYLVYSNVLGRQWPQMAHRSFVTTAKSITGPWSDPIYLNSVGFDPAFFFDGEKAYLINMVLDYQGWPQMIGFMLQEYDRINKKLIGEAKMIFDLRKMDSSFFSSYPEGPHIYKKDGYYYLLFAAGGTYWKHQSWLARAESLFGPYELAPNNPVLTSIGSDPGSLQKAGQGSLVETQHGDWYIAHHVARPILPDSVSPLGRETSLQEITWTKDGWLKLKKGGVNPYKYFEVHGIPEDSGFVQDSTQWVFQNKTIPQAFQSLRSPMTENWISLRRKEGFLSIKGRQAITSLIDQSLVAIRWTSLNFKVETSLNFEPEHFLQQAGLTLFYDTEDFQYLYITKNKQGNRVLRMMVNDRLNGLQKFRDLEQDIPVGTKVYLKVEVRGPMSQFYYALYPDEWIPIGPKLDIGHLSDEGHDHKKNGFTGAFVGLAVQDRLYESKWAEFGHLKYSDLSK